MLHLVLLVAGIVAPDTPPPAPPPAPSAAEGPAGQIHGTVAYGRHQFAIGAVVLVKPVGAPTPVFLATTGESGAFAFDHLANGVYSADVRRDGCVPVIKTGIPVKSPFRAVVEIALQRGDPPPTAEPTPTAEGEASVTGIVKFAGAGPLAEARVRLVRSDGSDDPRTALTAGDGSFSFSGLRAGGWRVEILGAGLLPLRASVRLTGAVTLEAALASQPANYRPPAQDLIVPEEVLPPPDR